MSELSLPLLLLLVVLPALGAVVPRSFLTGRGARRVLLLVTGVELALAIAVAAVFHFGGEGGILVDPFDPGRSFFGRPFLFVDELSSLLLPFGALVFGMVALVLPRTERHRASTRRILAMEACTLSVFLTAEPVLLAGVWVLSTLPGYRELSVGPRARRAEGLYMLGTIILFTAGVALEYFSEVTSPAGRLADVLILGAVLTRKGIVPFHSWMLGFFEHAALPTAILFTAPQVGAYAAARLIVPHAPDAVLTVIGVASLATAVYGAGLALVQSNPRRAFGAFFMSQSALVMAGLDSRTTLGLAGGLALWISSGVALAGFGMTLAALEARRGSLSLRTYSGGYQRTPFLATSFLFFGLAAVGFPGTLGFAGEEALVDGVVGDFPQMAIAVMMTSALNGLLVLRAYFRLFGGARVHIHAFQRTRPRERAGFLLLVGVLLALGLAPGSFLMSRHRAAEAILRARYGDSTSSAPRVELDEQPLTATLRDRELLP